MGAWAWASVKDVGCDAGSLLHTCNCGNGGLGGVSHAWLQAMPYSRGKAGAAGTVMHGARTAQFTAAAAAALTNAAAAAACVYCRPCEQQARLRLQAAVL